MDFVVIGGDAAGMSAASRAKRNRPDIRVTVIEKTHDVSYSACGMPYNIADPSRPMKDLVVREADVFRKQGIAVLTGHHATRIDRAAKTVSGRTLEGNSFSVSYDALLIATGASAIVPDIPGLALPGVMVLKHLEDGRRIKNFIEDADVKRSVIIGMGYIAMEMCEALRERHIQVSMIKPGPGLLPWMDPQLSRVVQQELESSGVALYPGVRILDIKQGEKGFNVHGEGVDIEADMIIVAVGVKPNSGIAVEAGLETSAHGAISTDSRLRTSDPHIYAAGDCADAFHAVTGQRVWIPLALRANRAGWAVADNVSGKSVSLPGIVGTAVFRVLGLEVARTGLTVQEAVAAGFRPVSGVIQSRSRAHAHPGASQIWVQMVADHETGRLLGVQMVGREGVAHRINAVAVALHNRMTVEDFSRTDLAYAPPFGPVWDPLLTAANQLLKKIAR
ncbi:MAG: FAD-dependent oxidoreductase [Deltaproteobacteria bacterium]|nr:FAD-dependent oxidoreductase [Deltaproteobacteria bacterium]